MHQVKYNLSIKFVCNICGKQFIGKGNLREHILMKHENQQETNHSDDYEHVKYDCIHCDKQFTTHYFLTRHIQSEHEGVEYVCNQCVYQSSSKGNMTKHIQSKHQGVKCACNQCGKQFTFQSAQRNHIRSQHQGVKYACNQCDYKASEKYRLSIHKKQHW